MGDQIQIGDKVKTSGVGPGVITGFSERGYPKVNDVACAWIEFEDGTTFGLGPRAAPPKDTTP